VAQGTPADLRREIFGHSTYQLELSGNLTALPDALSSVDASLKVTAQTDPDAGGFSRVTLTTGRDDDLGETLIRTLLARDLRVRALTRSNPTLEDVFLAATRRSWDAVAPAARPQEDGSSKMEDRSKSDA
jgi:ABC-2 type transport system ATP-binding protein